MITIKKQSIAIYKTIIFFFTLLFFIFLHDMMKYCIYLQNDIFIFKICFIDNYNIIFIV